MPSMIISVRNTILTPLLGYARITGEMVLFTGDQDDIEVELTSKDKLIVFCNH